VAAGPLGGVHAASVHRVVATGPYAGAAVGHFSGVAVGPGGVRVAGSRTVVVNHITNYVSPTVIRTQAVYVRGGYYNGAFTNNWYRFHAVAWRPLRWRVANFWMAPVWTNLAVYCGISAPPMVYNYGSNVVINNNYVYANGTQVATADQYAEQAARIADVGRAAQLVNEDQWQPLGAFGLVRGDETAAQHIFQLAINKDGIIRGNYYDAVSDTTLPVYGSLNLDTQRVAWSIGEKKTIVYEAGLNNLTQNQASVLAHYGTDRTQQLMLIRLDAPSDGNG
jgi:hypothetical protein